MKGRLRIADTAVLLPVALVFVAPIWTGFFRSYVHSPDADIVFAYQALALNDGVNAINAEHTGYIYFLIFSIVLRLMHAVGALGIDRIAPLLPLDDAGFDRAYGAVVFVGRGLSLVIASFLVAVVYYGTRALTRSAAAAIIVAGLVAVSQGTAYDAMLLRTELPAALFLVTAFFCLTAAVDAGDGANTLWLGLAGLCAALAMAAKVQAVFALLALPVAVLPFGARPPAYAGPYGATERAALALFGALLAAALAVPVAAMLWFSIDFQQRGGNGGYQTAIIAYLAVMAGVYAGIYRVTWVRALTGTAALVSGFCLGMLLHLLHPNPPATAAIGAVIEHMMPYSPFAKAANIPYSGMAHTVFEGAGRTLAEHVNPAVLLRRPDQLLDWALAASAIAWAAAGQYRRALQITAMLGLSVALQAAFELRALTVYYLAFIESWLAVGLAIAIAPLQRGVSRLAVGAAAIGAIALNVSTELNPQFLPPQPKQNTCDQADGYMPALASKFDHLCR